MSASTRPPISPSLGTIAVALAGVAGEALAFGGPAKIRMDSDDYQDGTVDLLSRPRLWALTETIAKVLSINRYIGRNRLRALISVSFALGRTAEPPYPGPHRLRIVR